MRKEEGEKDKGTERVREKEKEDKGEKRRREKSKVRQKGRNRQSVRKREGEKEIKREHCGNCVVMMMMMMLVKSRGVQVEEMEKMTHHRNATGLRGRQTEEGKKAEDSLRHTRQRSGMDRTSIRFKSNL